VTDGAAVPCRTASRAADRRAAGDLRADLVLAPDPATVRGAREVVAQQCHRAGIAVDVCETALLLTSEVVTNAVLHGRSEVRLRVVVTPGVLHVEVGDDNSRHPQRASPDDGALDGRGMAIIDVLATRWGVRDTPNGKVVWFDVAVRD